MSNLSHHNNYTPSPPLLPPADPLHAHTTLQTKMLRLADRGDASDGVHTAPGGCLLADIMPSRTFKQPTP